MLYDIIIVGAGSAGCVLASRLSEDPNRSVLLLEAGPDYPDVASLPEDIRNSHVPAFSHDWGFRSEPGKLGRALDLPRAKLVGGCSATNATLALRGTPGDYDEWAAQDNADWAFADVLPFFRRLENDPDFKNEWHGQTGPLPIRRYSQKELTPGQLAFLQACTNAGYKRIEDHNAPDATGAGPAPMNQINGIRQSTSLTYLAQARRRPNLTIKADALVNRVLFRGNHAVGVCLAGSGKKISAQHVILSAGAYSSPAILMRSGIGPADHLKKLGIDVLMDLAGVGENLMDHPLFWLSFEAKKPDKSEEVPQFQTLLTLNSSKAKDGHDLQVIPISIQTSEEAGDDSNTADFNMFVALMKPLSRGHLYLRSRNPSSAPRIDLGYFAHPSDMPRLVEAIRIARNIAKTPPLSKLVRREIFPGSRISSISALTRVVSEAANTYHHPVGTCHMGPDSEKGAVVDSHGNVYGVEALSVVDASIMPTIPSANTNLPTIMIAEHGADWLRAIENL